MSGVENGADLTATDAAIAGVQVEVDNLDGDAMRGTENAALAAVATEARLAELDAANLPRDIEEHDEHFHNRERWFGKSADQSGNDWAVPSGLTAFRAISGNSDFGGDADDEALLLGTADTPVIAGQTLFDMHRIMVDAASHANPWVLRTIWGTGTMADAETAGQYSDVMVTEARKGSPTDIRILRLDAGVDKVWMRAKSGTDNGTIDFFVGAHGYV